jgi:trehalose 6-phosphate phosphatase
MFAGDDVNDEPVFAAAAQGWLTVHVGNDACPTLAQFRIDGPHEMAMLLERMRSLLCTPDAPPLGVARR